MIDILILSLSFSLAINSRSDEKIPLRLNDVFISLIEFALN